jgi:hypothetical protein
MGAPVGLGFVIGCRVVDWPSAPVTPNQCLSNWNLAHRRRHGPLMPARQSSGDACSQAGEENDSQQRTRVSGGGQSGAEHLGLTDKFRLPRALSPNRV